MAFIFLQGQLDLFFIINLEVKRLDLKKGQ